MNLPAAILSFVLATSASLVESKSAIRGFADASPRDLQTCPFVGTPAEACCKFFALGYDPFDFDNYGNWYKVDSTLTLAQAGTYTGPDAIEEYVRFASDEANGGDYFMNFTPLVEQLGFKEIDEDGMCVFTVLRTIKYTPNKLLVKPVGIEQPFKVASFATIHHDPTSEPLAGYPFGYIKKTNVFFASGFLKFFFGALDTPETRKFICTNVLAVTCAGITPHPGPDCESDLAKLPATENSYFDGDSQGCRALHAVMAKLNPFHCPHVTLDPDDTDAKGVAKCSESSGVRPLDLFDGSDIGLFRQYCDAQGINPAQGYLVL